MFEKVALVVRQTLASARHVETRLLGISASLGSPRGAHIGASKRAWLPYAFSLGLIALATSIGLWMGTRLQPMNLATLFLLAVGASALQWGYGPAVLAAIASALVLECLFLPPLLTFIATDRWHLITFVGLIVVGLVISAIAGRARTYADLARKGEAHSSALCSYSQSLAVASDVDQICRALSGHVATTLGHHTVILLPQNGQLRVQFCSPELAFSEDHQACANSVFRQGQKAVCASQTPFPGYFYYFPLKAERGVLGVLGVHIETSSGSPSADQERLVEAFAGQGALAVERALFHKEAVEAQLLREADKLQRALLHSISHHLRSPLTSIIGTLTTILECNTLLDETTKRRLLETAHQEAGRLNRVVGNLLDIARLEAGITRPATEPRDPKDLIDAVIEELSPATRGRAISVDVPSNLPLVPLDFVLTSHVLVNLLDNAVTYSPPNTPIQIRVRVADDHLEIGVLDCGKGIPERDLEHIFDRFNHAGPTGKTEGLGLGLSICKGSVEAQGGRIWAQCRPQGGTVVTFALCLCERPALRRC